MGTKTNDYCSQCPQKAGCKEVYEHLGHSDAPSVVGKVVAAFLLPIALFVGLLIGADNLLPVFSSEKVRTAAIFLISLTATLATVWLFGRAGRYTIRK
jgi:hypothetical protein